MAGIRDRMLDRLERRARARGRPAPASNRPRGGFQPTPGPAGRVGQKVGRGLRVGLPVGVPVAGAGLYSAFGGDSDISPEEAAVAAGAVAATAGGVKAYRSRENIKRGFREGATRVGETARVAKEAFQGKPTDEMRMDIARQRAARVATAPEVEGTGRIIETPKPDSPFSPAQIRQQTGLRNRITQLETGINNNLERLRSSTKLPADESTIVRNQYQTQTQELGQARAQLAEIRAQTPEGVAAAQKVRQGVAGAGAGLREGIQNAPKYVRQGAANLKEKITPAAEAAKRRVTQAFTSQSVADTINSAVDKGANVGEAIKEGVTKAAKSAEGRFAGVRDKLKNFRASRGKPGVGTGAPEEVRKTMRQRLTAQLNKPKFKSRIAKMGVGALPMELISSAGQVGQKIRGGMDVDEAIVAEGGEFVEELKQMKDYFEAGPSVAQVVFDVAQGVVGLAPQAYKVGSNTSLDLGGEGNYYDLEQDPFDFKAFDRAPALDTMADLKQLEPEERRDFLNSLTPEEAFELRTDMRQGLGLPAPEERAEEVTEPEVGLRDGTDIQVGAEPEPEVAPEVSSETVVGASPLNRSTAGLRTIGPEVGPPSMRNFEFTPGQGRGIGRLGFDEAQPEFDANVRESIEEGAFNPLTQERFDSAQQVQQGRLRALKGLRQLSASRRGVPEYALDADREGRPYPAPPAGGGVGAMDLLKLQQNERGLRVRERAVDTGRSADYRAGFESEDPTVRRNTRERAVTDAIRDPNDTVAENSAVEGIAQELVELGNPGLIDMLLPFNAAVPGALRGSPQGVLDDDTEASAVGVLSGRLQQGNLIVRMQNGVPTLFAGNDPIAAYQDLSPRTREFLEHRGLIQVQRPGLRQE